MGAARASNGTITFGNWAHLLNLAHHLFKVKTHFWRALSGGAFAEFGEVQVDEGGLNVAVTELALELPQGEPRPLATDGR